MKAETLLLTITSYKPLMASSMRNTAKACAAELLVL